MFRKPAIKFVDQITRNTLPSVKVQVKPQILKDAKPLSKEDMEELQKLCKEHAEFGKNFSAY